MIAADPNFAVDPNLSGDPNTEDAPYLNDEIWTVKEAAHYLKVSPYSLREVCRKKQIPHFRVGNKAIRFSKDDVMKWKHKQANRNYR